jgi:ABC-type antimicrobial peptide transport system ATPase subunit
MGSRINIQETIEKARKQIVSLTIDSSTLPQREWKAVGWEKRQVIELDIRRVVTEYQHGVILSQPGMGGGHHVYSHR